MHVIIQFATLFSFLALGELIVWLTNIPIPSSIIGMLLLTSALKLKLVKPSMIEQLSKFLIHNLGLFFIPAGVGLMNCFGIIADQWLPIIGATIVSTIIIIAVTGWSHKISRKYLSRKNTQSPL